MPKFDNFSSLANFGFGVNFLDTEQMVGAGRFVFCMNASGTAAMPQFDNINVLLDTEPSQFI